MEWYATTAAWTNRKSYVRVTQDAGSFGSHYIVLSVNRHRKWAGVDLSDQARRTSH